MTARTRPASLLIKTAMILLVPLVVAAVVGTAQATASSSPAPAEKVEQPLVNWGWLAAGLGGMVVLLVVMFLLTRVFGGRRREEE
jgi:hypothetical protein